jgi:polyisoprenoid-binding protein YceI
MSSAQAEATGISQLEAGTWQVDSSHSSVEFTARHLMVSKVRGRFTSFSGTIEVAEDPLQSSLQASVDLASVETHDEKRDGHLRSADFFDVENHPQMTLVSTGIRPDGDHYVLSADVTVRGITRPVEFDLEFNGVERDPWGGTRAGFTATTEVNRRDWGLEWNVPLDGGGLLVSEKVKITLEVEAVKA